MSQTTHDPSSLNQAAAHDTGLYDPALHDNQIVALYDTDAAARAAMETVAQAGYPRGAMHVVAGRGEVSHERSGTDALGSGGSIWEAIKDFFAPDEDRTGYDTALSRGHAMLVVIPDHGMDRQGLVKVLESTGPVDFDARLEEWRQAGYDTTGQAPGTPASNVATAGHAVDGGLNTRSGRRETMESTRLRSYIADRPSQMESM